MQKLYNKKYFQNNMTKIKVKTKISVYISTANKINTKLHKTTYIK